ncbi:tetratricopeptide repeat protein [Reichenbachiella versicolor]|uniref:tetratricopeptide repeat protein n=1 Tax=Reichenbachiella versicolor TaxID=1821036 RepID=UPI000D6E37B3|nr:tetratricopeptide repeat protein [Reichenbachiella versicolor]
MALIIRTLLLTTLALFTLEVGYSENYPVFDSPKILAIMDYGGDFIYNEQYDSAEYVIDSLEVLIPDHPLIFMMRAFNVSWKDQPIRTTSIYFPEHRAYLDTCLMMSEKLLDKNPKNLEAKFFKMSVHGLYAEYYAKEGSYMKAMGHAQKTYGLIKETMEKTDESSELYFLAGLYNYFREKYPERHPVYKPLLWFFKSGDIKLGLEQLDKAVYDSKIVKIEACLYASYIYLRYENNLDKAGQYLQKINAEYPRNKYFKAKYLECLVRQKKYDEALPLIDSLKQSEVPYYQLCGYTYEAIYTETKLHEIEKAEELYLKAIENGINCVRRGEYYKSLAYLGLGRITESRNDHQIAAAYYNKAIEEDDDPRVSAEARERLKRLNL